MKAFTSPTGDIFLGSIADGLKGIIQSLHASSVVVVADDHTTSLCVPLLKDITDITYCITIPSGEPNKNIDRCEEVWAALMAYGADRSTLVLNVGGGMICDLGGFAAACYQRGIRFGHIPTSLLAMADAAIGGKTGVNFHGFKNYLGRFETPAFIWIDPVFLNTLPEPEFIDGLAEIIKHAIIAGGPLWQLVSKTEKMADLHWLQVLELNTPVKQRIVEMDPDEKGFRKTLNFGHTIGHALESHFLHAKQPVSHGRAVTLGMLAETRLSLITGLLGNEDFQAIIGLIERFLGPYEVTLPPAGRLGQWLAGDKKKSGGRIGYSLPERIGLCRWDVGTSPEHVEQSLNWLSAQVRG